MKLNLKNALIATSIAAGLFGASAVAIAQNTTAAPTVMAEQGMQAPQKAQRAGEAQAQGDKQGKHRADRMAKMDKLKAELKLAPEQEAAWSAFVERTAHEPRMAGKNGAQREDWSKLTTPERLDKMQARHAERGEQMAQRIDATKGFYAALTPEQQKTFDSQSMRGFQRTGMKGDKRGMGHHGHHHGKHMDHKMGPRSAEDMPGKQS